MKQHHQLVKHASLEAVATAFEQWRSTRTGRGRIPEHLWQAAMDLSPSYSLCKIASALRLDYNRLRRRFEQHPPEASASQFIEVRMDGLVSGNQQCIVHLRSPAGFEMTVQAPTGSEHPLPLLVDHFLRQAK